MHINLETYYSIRIADVLAKSFSAEGKRLSAIEISERANVPQRFTIKILRKLVAGGIVKSYKGVYGGYEFCDKPSRVSLYDVVMIAEGQIKFSRCLHDDYACSGRDDELTCAYRLVFGKITEEFCEILKRYKFDSLT